MRQLSVLTVVGARPQFIKAAPVSRAFGKASGFREVIIHTGQHFDHEMSAAFFNELGIPEPSVNLGVHGGPHGAMTGRMLIALEEQMDGERPDWVLVYGDTNSTLAGALAAAKLHIPVAHVEAGLRSFNRRMPEEINRVVVDHLSDLKLCPTRQSMLNLQREGIVRGVHQVGDVMFDACLDAAKRAESASDVLDRLGVKPGAYALATVHRAENVDVPEALHAVIDYLKDEAARQPVVFPIHPRTEAAVKRLKLELSPLIVCSPLTYLQMARLLTGCTMVFTDSGGLQKEAYFHEKQCVTLRDETEWIETVECGWNRLWRGPGYETRRPIPDYGDGHAADRIVNIIREHT